MAGLPKVPDRTLRAAFDRALAEKPDQLAQIGPEGRAEPPAPAPIDAADLLAHMYTSGTTGRSKRVLVSHAHAFTYASREDQQHPVADDRILVTPPLFHLASQWYGICQALIHRARCVLEPRFSVSRFWPTVREHGITVTVMLGAMAELLHKHLLRQAGVGDGVWDREAAGIVLRRSSR